MKKKANNSEISVEELQQIFLNSPSFKKMHEESEKIVKKLQLPPRLQAN